jgi:hypothetical protein
MRTKTNLEQVLDLLGDNLALGHGQHTKNDDRSLSLRLGDSSISSYHQPLSPILLGHSTHNTPATAY